MFSFYDDETCVTIQSAVYVDATDKARMHDFYVLIYNDARYVSLIRLDVWCMIFLQTAKIIQQSLRTEDKLARYQWLLKKIDRLSVEVIFLLTTV